MAEGPLMVMARQAAVVATLGCRRCGCGKIAGASQHVPEQIVHIGVIVAEFRHAAQQRQRLRITLKVVIQQLQQPGPGQRTVVIDGFLMAARLSPTLGAPAKAEVWVVRTR